MKAHKAFKLKLRRMTPADVEAISAIHLEQFPRSRTTRLGILFVRKMYSWFLHEHPELAITAEVDGRPVGFVVGSIGGYGRAVFRYAFPEALIGMVLHPWLIVNRNTYRMWRSYLMGLIRPARHRVRQHSPALKIVKGSLASIAVCADFQGTGIAGDLLRTFEAAAGAAGVTWLGLSVHSENLAARRLYERGGWEIVPEYAEPGSCYYRKVLQS